MEHIPSDFVIGGIFVPPLLAAFALGWLAATLTAIVLNRARLAHYFASPPLVYIALTVIYTLLIGTFFVPV